MTPLETALCVACPAAALIFAALFALYSNRAVGVTKYIVPFPVEEGLKIVQISDLHGASFGRHNARLLAKVQREKPDIIAVTGDIIHKYTPRNVNCALGTVSALSQIARVLYVSGNHEMRNKGYRTFKKQLAEAGAEVLDNASCKAGGVTFVGLNGAHNKNGTIFRITPHVPAKILLAHMPQYFPAYAAAGYDLVLSGHAHGGQWRIPFTRKGVYAPGQGLFPRYVCGIYTEGASKMILSRGLGNSEFPLRLFNRPEIVSVTLVPAKKPDRVV